MENKTHWKKLNNPNYIGAYELMGVTDELTVKITKVVKESIKNMNGGDEDCTIAYLENQKPMILNATNCKIISKIYNTPFIEDWAGLKITLIVQQVKAFGDIVDALRIKQTIPSKIKLAPGHEKWADAVKYYSDNNNIDNIKKHYELSKENEKKLKDAAGIS
jgi:hypothetical protein